MIIDVDHASTYVLAILGSFGKYLLKPIFPSGCFLLLFGFFVYVEY